jgi:valyl-tRNA synthetase
VPWRTALISGWGLSEQGKKLSKRDLDRSTGPDGFNRYVPDDVMAKYGADALRLWATKSRIGTDLRYNEKDIRTGRKFAVKLLERRPVPGPEPRRPRPVGGAGPGAGGAEHRGPVGALAPGRGRGGGHAAFEAHDYMQAHQAASRMFWSIYCDRYIEMIKDRLGDPMCLTGHRRRRSAQWTLRESYRVLLGLFAPFAPFVTEHMYQQFYRAHEERGLAARDPLAGPDPRWRGDRSAVDQLAVILDATRVLRSGLRLGNSARLSQLIVQAHAAGPRRCSTRSPNRSGSRPLVSTRSPRHHRSGRWRSLRAMARPAPCRAPWSAVLNGVQEPAA